VLTEYHFVRPLCEQEQFKSGKESPAKNRCFDYKTDVLITIFSPKMTFLLKLRQVPTFVHKFRPLQVPSSDLCKFQPLQVPTISKFLPLQVPTFAS
jgi:hypothetical protein